MAKDDGKFDGRTGERSYDAQDITVLEGLEAVRKRPGMYIGSTGVRGLHHLVYEVVDNSVDEALAGHCTRVDVTIHPDNSVTVVDDGRGIPVGIMEKEQRPAVEVVLTVLHAGGKFGDGGGYKVSGGLHGVGVSVVNALSELLLIEIRREDHVWRQEYQRGAPQAPLSKDETSSDHGTTITFRPDAEIFETTDLDFSVLEQRLRETAFLTRGLKISITDERGEGAKAEFRYEGGIEDFVRYLNANKESIGRKVVYFEGESAEGAVEIAMQWNTTYQESVFSFANNINTHEGGSHMSGFRAALTRTLNRFAREKGHLKEKDENLTGEDVREGLTAIISAKLSDPQFEGQTKTKLGNPGMEGFVASVVNASLAEFLEENPQEGNAIIRKAVSAAQARAAARKARDLTRRKSALENSTLPGKLADCSVKDPSLAEIFIVEGDSAGGSAKQGRDRNTQAVLPLRGKILNVEKSRIDKVLKNLEIQALITAIGTGVRDEFDLEKARYHKIILMTDADVDGAHIRTLALTLLFREMPELIEAGYIYIAKPPLYKLKQGSQRALHREGLRARGDPPLRQAREDRLLRPRRDAVQAHRDALAALLAAAQAVPGLVVDAARRVRPRHGRLPRGVGHPRRARRHDRRRARAHRSRPDRRTRPTRRGCSAATRRRSSSARSRRSPAWRGRCASRCACSARRTTATSPGARPAHRARRPRAVHGEARRHDDRRRVLRGAARRGPDRLAEGHHAAALQGARGDERRAAARHDDGPRDPHARAGLDRGRGGGRPHLLDAHGRHGRAAPPVHRGQRAPRRQPRRLGLCDSTTPPPPDPWHRSTRFPEATSSRARSRTRCARRTSTTRCPSSSGVRCPTSATA